MAKRNKKRAVPSAALPSKEDTRKVPRKLRGVVPATEDPDVAQRKPAWGLSLLDMDGELEWGGWPTDSMTVQRILAFLKEMERLTWSDIWAQMSGGNRRRGQKHKPIPVESLTPAAQARLSELDLDDHPELFRFRLGNMERLWGVFVGDHHVFYPIWWDCDHKICP